MYYSGHICLKMTLLYITQLMEHELENKLRLIKKKMRALQKSYDVMRTLFHNSNNFQYTDVNNTIIIMHNNRHIYEDLMWKKHDVLRELNRINESSSSRRIILTSREDLEEIQPQCGICLGHHMKIDIIMLQCNHSFGENCFKRWATSKGIPECPNCKCVGVNTRIYREFSLMALSSSIWSNVHFTPSYSIDETPVSSMFGECCTRVFNSTYENQHSSNNSSSESESN